MGIRFADHVTPLYPQKLALTSPTGGGRSVGIIRSRTKATEFSFSLVLVGLIWQVFCMGIRESMAANVEPPETHTIQIALPAM